jgi:response regulator RpfG family c-di-GMP phosphodiesterase
MVLDMQMPDGTAADVLARASDVATGMPILLLTGATASETQRFRDEARVRSILKKPVDPLALQRALREVLGEAEPPEAPLTAS